jgi:hypothetical protein
LADQDGGGGVYRGKKSKSKNKDSLKDGKGKSNGNGSGGNKPGANHKNEKSKGTANDQGGQKRRRTDFSGDQSEAAKPFIKKKKKVKRS